MLALLIASIVSVASIAPPALAASKVADDADLATTASALPHPKPISFAVLANLPSSMTNEHDTQAMLQWIAEVGQVHFIVDLGNVRGPDESCGNALFARRQALLNATPSPVIFVPGMRDWVDCARPGAGSFDPIERLDAVRDLFLSGNLSLGSPAMRVIRQSELPAFTPYRENMRWIDDGVVFATLNVPGGNNHFVDGGGRNGEYEDREVANRNWIDHAVIDAQRRHARGLVFLFEGDPGFASRAAQAAAQRIGGSHWAEPFDWWFRRPRERDGYASLRRDLLRAVARFDGPVLIIHGRDTPRSGMRTALSTTENARNNGSLATKREGQRAAHDPKRDARQAELAPPPTVAVETLTHAPDGLLLHQVQQVMVDNPAGSRQWLRVTLPTTSDPHPGAALNTHGNASGAAHTRGTGRERDTPAHGSPFQIRVETADDDASDATSTTPQTAWQNRGMAHDTLPGVSPPIATPPVFTPTASSDAAATALPGATMRATDGTRGSGGDAAATAAPAATGQVSPPAAMRGTATLPTNDMGLPPWPGKAFRPHRNSIDDNRVDTTPDSRAMTGDADDLSQASGTAYPSTATTAPNGQTSAIPGRPPVANANAKSTSEHDVLQSVLGPSGPMSSAESAGRTTGFTQAPSPLPGELPEPSDPVETGIAEGSDGTGTSALNGITQPTMLPLPPIR
jgi:hypothetical protein